MINILKNVYKLDNKHLKLSIEKNWNRYQYIINKKKPSWDEANEARAILYLLGHYLPEVIALESLEKRVKYVKPKMNIDKFLEVVDKNDSSGMKQYLKDKNFKKLKEFYLIIKSLKNKVNKGKLYLDEDIFNKMYRKLTPKDHI